uniref:Uncharacterized protein n=1 Tax=Mola mola TaxID=94237 RepID=A0A3Q3XHH3_MOLML
MARKIDAKGRLFNERWECEYFFVLSGNKLELLLCYEAVAVEYNLRWHFNTEIFDTELSIICLRMFSAKNDAAVKASFIVASKCFSEGPFLKQCMQQICEQVCPDKKHTFNNVSLSRNTILAEECSYPAIPLTVDESLSVSEEILDVVAMHGARRGGTSTVSWWGLLNHGTPAMCKERAGLVRLVKDKMQKRNCHIPLTTYYCILYQEDLCSKTLEPNNKMTNVMKVLNFIQTCCTIQNFKEKLLFWCNVKGNSRPNCLAGLDPNWLCDFAQMCDTTEHLTRLNPKMQGSFQQKLCLWTSHLEQNNVAHFPVRQSISNLFPGAFSLLMNLIVAYLTLKEQHLIFTICTTPLSDGVNTTSVQRWPERKVPGHSTAPTSSCRALFMFEGTYLCKRMFSIIHLNKTKHRSHIIRDLKPDINGLSSGKQCQSSDQETNG